MVAAPDVATGFVLAQNAPIAPCIQRLNPSSKLSVDNIPRKQHPRVSRARSDPAFCSAGADGGNFRRMASTPYEGRGFRRPPRNYAQLDLFAGRQADFTKSAEEPAALEPEATAVTLGRFGHCGACGRWSGRSSRTLCSDQVACIGFAARHQEFVRPGTCSHRQMISFGQSTRFRPPPTWSQVEP